MPGLARYKMKSESKGSDDGELRRILESLKGQNKEEISREAGEGEGDEKAIEHEKSENLKLSGLLKKLRSK